MKTLLLTALALFIATPVYAEVVGCSIAKQQEFEKKCTDVRGGTFVANSCTYNTNTRRYSYSCKIDGVVEDVSDANTATSEPIKVKSGESSTTTTTKTQTKSSAK